MKDLTLKFQNPGADYRGKPFWSWNGKLDETELLRQIHVFKEMGFGGFFMHSRTGLVTEYLGDEWFRLINLCADEAERLGMEAWLYDEDRWPSGTAGGLVTENSAYSGRFISLRPTPGAEVDWSQDIVAAFSCASFEGIRYSDAKRIDKSTPRAEYAGKTVLIFTIELQENSPFYNGHTYVDTLNGDATAEYIRLTHERYKETAGARLGHSIKGIFTDEPHRGPVMSGFSIGNENRLWMAPWTDKLPARFQETFGSDLIAHLPELFLQPDGEPVSVIKWQYMELLQQMFLTEFAKPLYDWCEANDLLLTGHALHEDSLTAQAAMQGSLMRHYEYMHVPGVDVLTEGNRNLAIVKQLASAARQLGQKWMLSELYGCTGWQMTFEDHKQVGDWQALLGINLRCHHLSWYTMEGEAKRDYPASIAHQSAWWDEYDTVESYFARLGLIRSHGERVCDVLVVNPIESLWCQIHAGWAHSLTAHNAAINDLERGYSELSSWLYESQIDFDYGDEEMIGRLSAIGRDQWAQPIFNVGQARYKTVIVGRHTTLRSTTLKLLAEFEQAGGSVIFVGDAPRYIDAKPSGEASALASRCQQVAWKKQAFIRALRDSAPSIVSTLESDSDAPSETICCQVFEADGNISVIALNNDLENSVEGVRFKIHGRGFVEEWDCATGKRYAHPAEYVDGWTEFETSFAPSAERVFLLTARCDRSLAPRAPFHPAGSLICTGPFAYTLSEPNVCVLDFARYRINRGDWSERLEILKADRALRPALGLPLRAGDMVQPWFRDKFHTSALKTTPLALSFDFHCDALPEGNVKLALERPERWRASLNGAPIALNPDGIWIDSAFPTCLLPNDAIQLGANEIVLETEFDESVNLEAIYLLGDFGVRLNGARSALIKRPELLEIGDVASQGLPFYGGKIRYEIPLLGLPQTRESRLQVSVPGFEGACVKIGLNSVEKIIAWPPFQAEIESDARAPHMTLEVLLTRRNTFGPLHQSPLLAGAYGPGNFLTEGSGFSEGYMLLESGLLQPPTVAWTTGAAPSDKSKTQQKARTKPMPLMPLREPETIA